MRHVVIFLLAGVTAVCWFAYRRVHFLRVKQYESFPRPSVSLLWGHLRILGAAIASLSDPRKHPDLAFESIAQLTGNPPILCLDLRPLRRVVCVIRDHALAEQITRATRQAPYSLPKSASLSILLPVIGSHSIVYVSGHEWKRLRKTYNPGFSPQHLATLLPRIIDKTVICLELLDKHARSGAECDLGRLFVNLTFDIIGAIVLDMDLEAQSSKKHALVSGFESLQNEFLDSNWLVLSPWRVWKRWRAGVELDRTIKVAVREKHAELKRAPVERKSIKAKSVLALSLQETDDLDAQSLTVIAHQIRTFLFAGHDTTAIALQWAFYELSRRPLCLAALRKEHDEILGHDASPEAVTSILRTSGKDVLNRLNYTSAVVKETLRLYPPAGTVRTPIQGSGFSIELPDGRTFPMEGIECYIQHCAIQRDPKIYGPTANDFVPERWLAKGENVNTSFDEPDHVSRSKAQGGIPSSAWRPFERGPRDCIGQELANLEIRVILAYVVRRYDFEKTGLGALLKDSKGMPIKEFTESGLERYMTAGEMFSTMQITSKPVDGVKGHLRFAQTRTI